METRSRRAWSALFDTRFIVGGLFGLVSAFILAWTLSLFSLPTQEESSETDANQPLYWVAPMDPSYRRDGPGKSPMGMDLVPVYEEQGQVSSAVGSVVVSSQVQQNLGVKTEIVKTMPMYTTVDTIGYIGFDEDSLVHIHPRLEGWIEKLFIKAEGDPVTQGEALYTLYSPQLVNAQEEFLIANRRQNAALLRASRARLSALQMRERDIDKLAKTGDVQQFVTFYAPQSGVVNSLQIREGFYVKPDTTMMSIGQLDNIWVEADIYENEIANVQEGMPVSIAVDAFPTRRWQGQVDYVYPALDPDTRTLKVRVSLTNEEDMLKPNMFARLTIHGNKIRTGLIAPFNAIIRTGKQNRVVVRLEDGSFKSVAVSLGKNTRHGIEIIDGLYEGDEIVVSGQFLIDSESSLSSDFKRFEEVVEVQSATVTGTINRIDSGARIMNISRSEIEKWNRPAATMDFTVDRDVLMSDFRVGQSVMFTFDIRDGDFVIVAMHEMTEHRMHDTNIEADKGDSHDH
ncbi:efflux RND transporter periplasmic adaptor subunit [Aestuariibacter sp. AA17]|uniref:Efflux RND transporter periplasmic adaptor subunit n=1 Tax=Fluctibacter corallii TaxID=2984329 RepID=A0ABT3A467_9ALTE|nr:efflux RND transporter periplasmic adaptor subunit [Aestuariibacter sp. AA17]MCV2883393.1 efflux RND transporter periplasmic adaptor subunit [Aestuariibacter sp. AA17]